MANNIEWSLASIPPAIADPDDLHAEEPLGEDEVAVWLGTDAAAVLYGQPDDLIEWGKKLIALMEKHKEENAMDYEEIAEAQGWTPQTLLGLMAGFIANAGLRDQFTDHCAEVATEENAHD